MADDTERRPRVGRSRREDEREVVPLLFASGAEIYPRFAGSPEAALAVLAAAFRRPGTRRAPVAWVAGVDGRLAGGDGRISRRGRHASRAPLSPPRAPQAAAVAMAASVAQLSRA